MTAVETPTERDLDALYVDRRGDLYRALVLITDDRDLSVEAIDRAFAKFGARWRSPEPRMSEPVVLAAALRWVKKRTSGRNAELRGFRLPTEETATDGVPDIAAFRTLEVDDRSAVVGRHLFGWDADQIGTLLDRDSADAAAFADAAERRMRGAREGPLGDLATVLSDGGAALREPLSRLEKTKTKARLKKLSSAAAALFGGAVLAVGGTVAVNSLVGDGSSQPVDQAAPQPGGTAVSNAPQGVVALGDFTWTQVPLPVREGDISGVAHGPNGFIVLANDYSGRGPSSVIYQSQDGVSWEQLGAPPVGNSGWIQSLQHVGDQYIAIGSEFDDRAGQDSPKLWVSTDGLGWTETVLPVEHEIEVEGQVVPVYTYLQGVSGTAGNLVVVGGQHAELDPDRLLREFLPDGVSSAGGWGSSPDGIELYDNNGNVTFRGTWEELGVPEELAKLLSGSRSMMWTSEDGLEWQQTSIDIDVGFDGGIGRIVSAGDLRAAQVWAQFGAQVWIERQGSWERIRIPGAGSTGTVAAIGDRILVAGSDEGGNAAIWSTADGDTWELATGSIPGAVNEFFPGDGVVLATAQGGNFPGNNLGPAVLEVDGLTIEARQDGNFRVLEDGEEILSTFAEDAVQGSGGSMTLVDADGNEVVTFSQADVERAWETVFRSFEREIEPTGPPALELIVSSDGGRTWADVGFSAEVGTGFYPTGAAWHDGTIVLAGFSEGGIFQEGPPQVLVWVGTTDD